MEPVYYGHLGTNKKCPDYQGVLIFQVNLYAKAPFGTITKCVDYAGGVLINRFHCRNFGCWVNAQSLAGNDIVEATQIVSSI